ncbi:hypothetical protein L6452_21556 [Arctium lappa]|uniref:Uncharacterized protein n=1 Tax=Arctium lappa TaxID=4217 RepID=A0ACB9AWG5_ARCLA|nr:hypothetical protein L6452_21556 [Arctium lappa]
MYREDPSYHIISYLGLVLVSSGFLLFIIIMINHTFVFKFYYSINIFTCINHHHHLKIISFFIHLCSDISVGGY